MTVSVIRVVAFSLFALFFTAASIEMAGVMMGTASGPGQEIGAMAIALPALWSFLIILGCALLFRRFTRFELINRAELFCVLFTAMLAAPLMSVGFWRYLLPSIATFPRSENFAYLDTQNPKLWPHGPNLTEVLLAGKGDPRIRAKGSIRLESLTLTNGESEPIPVISHDFEELESTIRVQVPVAPGTARALALGEHYLLSVLSRAENLGSDSTYFCRLYYDDSAKLDMEIFAAVKESKIDFIQPEGFLRGGVYGLMSVCVLSQGFAWRKYEAKSHALKGLRKNLTRGLATQS